MRITKFGHACVRLETGDHTIVLDPGVFTEPEAVDGATAVLITHEHPDHYSADHLRRMDAPVHRSRRAARSAQTLRTSRAGRRSGPASVRPGRPDTAVGEKHAVIHPEMQHFDNSGYLLEVEDLRIFHPGDSLTIPPGTSTCCCSR